MRAVWLVGLLAAAGCTDDNCAAPCRVQDATLLKVEGYSIVGIASDCPNIVRSPETGSNTVVLSGNPYGALTGPPRMATTCHATITLDDGTEIPIVVNANIAVEPACCGPGLKTLFTASFQTIVIKAPAGYVPRDAGTDAPNDAPFG